MDKRIKININGRKEIFIDVKSDRFFICPESLCVQKGQQNQIPHIKLGTSIPVRKKSDWTHWVINVGGYDRKNFQHFHKGLNLNRYGTLKHCPGQ